MRILLVGRLLMKKEGVKSVISSNLNYVCYSMRITELRKFHAFALTYFAFASFSENDFISNFAFLKFKEMKEENSYKIASNLLKIGSVKFNFEEPFTWASGIKSPVYCDNRLSLSHVYVRDLIRDAYIQVIQKNFTDVEVIAGVATGAIAQGALVADKLGLPFVYVRNEAKKHGFKKSVEGVLKEGQRTIIIEDHVSTGGSSIKALEELRNEGANVLGMVAILSYDFPETVEALHKNSCEIYTLSEFSIIKEIAIKEGYITEERASELNKWHENPREYFR